jgi:hypothetical protein
VRAAITAIAVALRKMLRTGVAARSAQRRIAGLSGDGHDEPAVAVRFEGRGEL